MKRGYAFKAWVYLLCVSFLLLTSGLHTMIAEAKDVGRPLGEMVSRGQVKFESKKSGWKNVEPSQFLIFPGLRIKTEKGVSLMNLEGNRQIELGANSLLSFDRNDEIQLTQGVVNFRVPATAKLSFKMGDLTVIPWKSLQASRKTLPVSLKSEATIGSILVHFNGAVTIKSLQGPISVLNQKHVVLASLSSKDTLTLPSVTVTQKVMVAQTGKKSSASDPESSKFLGIDMWVWLAIGSVVAIAATTITVALVAGGDGGEGGAAVPVCP